MKAVKFDSFVRFRVTKDLRSRLERLAKRRVKTPPELAREALADFLDREEPQKAG